MAPRPRTKGLTSNDAISLASSDSSSPPPPHRRRIGGRNDDHSDDDYDDDYEANDSNQRATPKAGPIKFGRNRSPIKRSTSAMSAYKPAAAAGLTVGKRARMGKSRSEILPPSIEIGESSDEGGLGSQMLKQKQAAAAEIHAKSRESRSPTMGRQSREAADLQDCKMESGSRKPPLPVSDDDDFFLKRRPMPQAGNRSRRGLVARASTTASTGSAHREDAVATGTANTGRINYVRPPTPSSSQPDSYPVRPLSSSPVPSDDDSDDAARRRKKAKRLPSWTRQNSKQNYSFSDSEEGEASDRNFLSDSSQGSKSPGGTKQRGPGRRRKSVSLTPPPAVPELLEARARQVLDDMMSKNKSPSKDGSRRPSSSGSSESEGDYAHNPSTARTAKMLDHTRASRSSAKATADDSGEFAPQTLHPDLAALYRGAKAAEVRQRAKAEEAERKRRRMEEDQKAQEERARLAEERQKAGPSASNGQPVYTVLSDSSDTDSPVTAAALPRRSSHASATSASTTSPTKSTLAAAEAPEDDATRITLTLRASSSYSIDVRVRPTTTFSTILAHFLRGLPDGIAPPDAAPMNPDLSKSVTKSTTTRGAKATAAKTAKAMWDGEVLDPESTVGDLDDIDDGELIDILWS